MPSVPNTMDAKGGTDNNLSWSQGIRYSVLYKPVVWTGEASAALVCKICKLHHSDLAQMLHRLRPDGWSIGLHGLAVPPMELSYFSRIAI